MEFQVYLSVWKGDWGPVHARCSTAGQPPPPPPTPALFLFSQKGSWTGPELTLKPRQAGLDLVMILPQPPQQPGDVRPTPLEGAPLGLLRNCEAILSLSFLIPPTPTPEVRMRDPAAAPDTLL